MSDNTITREDGFGAAVEFYQRMADDLRLQLAERDATIIAFQTRVTELRHDLNMVIDQRNAANARIAELEAAQAWVSVDERLPDVDEVLAYSKDEWGYDVWEIDSYSLMQRRWLNDATPTHWMPLPPPPVTP